ncbi:MAG: tetratricopeptide repeat protein [Alphaproteobacteria bacterium]
MTDNKSILHTLNFQAKQSKEPVKIEKKEIKKEVSSFEKTVKKRQFKFPAKLAGLSLGAGIIFVILIYIFVPFSLAERAKRGDLQAQYGYAMQFFSQEQYDQYIFWMQKAAEQDSMRANFHLGVFYKDSMSYQNNEKAEKYLKEAAEKENKQALLILGKMYKDGVATTQDYKKAFHYLKKSADKGDREASFYVATLYALGQGTEQNYQKAYTYAQKCGDAESPLIQLIKSKLTKKDK